MSWISVVPPFMGAVLVLFVPGLLVGAASKLRGLALFALAPVLSATLIATAAILAPLAGLRWSLVPVVGLTVVVAAIAAVIAWWLAPRIGARKADSSVPAAPARSAGVEKPPTSRYLIIASAVGAILIGAFLVGRRLIAAFGRPDSFSQTFDNIFHLNALRYIADTGSGSSADLLSMTGSGFYPAAWHDVVSLVMQVTGAESTVSINLTNLAIGALIWPVGCIFLAQQLFGSRPVVYLGAGVLAAGFGAFPLLMVDFGVLYPNFFGNAMLAATFGLLINALGLARTERIPKLVAWLLVLATVPGLALVHPNSAMTLLALLLAPLALLWIRGVRSLITRRAPMSRYLIHLAILAATCIIVVIAWTNIRPPEEAATWGPIMSQGAAIGEILTSSAINRPAAWLIFALTVVGLANLVRTRRWWLLGSYATLAALFVVVASEPIGDQRMFLTGVWYNDPPRLAALLPVITLPIALAGVIYLWSGLQKALGKLKKSTQMDRQFALAASTAVALIAILGLVLGTQGANVRVATNSAAANYVLSDKSPLVTTDEYTLLKRLDQSVPEGALLIGNPYNGSALAYAFADRRTIQLHTLSQMPEGGMEIADHLNQAMNDPDVCPAVQETGVSYVLDFGRQEVHGGDHGFRGLDDLVAAGVAEVVDSEGAARVLKITACQ